MKLIRKINLKLFEVNLNISVNRT